LFAAINIALGHISMCGNSVNSASGGTVWKERKKRKTWEAIARLSQQNLNVFLPRSTVCSGRMEPGAVGVGCDPGKVQTHSGPGNAVGFSLSPRVGFRNWMDA